MQTRFFRFMMSLIKNTQNISRGVFAFVPNQDFNEEWTDEKLWAKYSITESEINFIDSLIRPMDLSQNEEIDE
jgi:site-specific DNA-methyltransferase (adenine-specific)